MAGSYFTVGRDGSLVVQHPLATGGTLILPLMTMFDVKPNPVTLKVVTIAGDHLEDYLPGNYTFTISCDRADSALDDFQSRLDAARHQALRVPTGTILQYITELNGSTSTYQYTQATFHVSEMGSFKGDDTVKQTLMGSAVTRIRVG